MRRQAELITSPPAPDSNINFVDINFLQASRRLRCSNENKRILSGAPCLMCRMKEKYNRQNFPHILQMVIKSSAISVNSNFYL